MLYYDTQITAVNIILLFISMILITLLYNNNDNNHNNINTHTNNNYLTLGYVASFPPARPARRTLIL